MRRALILAFAALLVVGVAAGPAAAGSAKPVTKPTADISVKRHFWPLFSYVIADRDSGKAKVTIVVARRKGPALARIDCGWQRTNRVVTVPMLLWRCDFSKGIYVWRVLAVDQDGNRQSKAWPARLTVY